MEYDYVPLGESGVRVLDCHHLTPRPAVSGFPYIAIPDIRDGRIEVGSARIISPSDFAIWTARTKPRAGDVLVTRRGRVGDTAAVPDGLECALGQDLVLLRSDGSQVDRAYLRWATRGPLWLREVDLVRNVGVVFDSLNVRDVPRMRIPLPPLAVQREIAASLGALDDKIDVNRRMGETLAEIARGLFQSWFVDFDPVRGTATVPEDVRRLFPDRLVDSPIGPVPEGWEVRPAGEVFEVVGGSTPSTQEPAYWGGGIPFATPKDMSLLSSPILTATQRGITREGAATIGSGVLPPRTVLMSSRAPIGYLALTAVPVAVNQGIIAVLPTSKLPPLFALNWLGANMRLIEVSANGSTFQEISKRSFRELPLALPNPEAVDAFESFAEHLYGLISSLSVESKTLADLRDTLLPKLLSGELKIAAPTGSAFSDGP